MIKVGITSGIGGGKSYITKTFASLGIPVYYTDNEARKLMSQDPIKSIIIKNFGKESFIDDNLNKGYITSIIFNDQVKLNLLNSIVHPPTILHSLEWCDKQNSPYIIMESALIFESGLSGVLDKIIGVYASKELRIERVMNRDNITQEEALKRMDKQMNEEKKMGLCDYIIINDGREIQSQVEYLHNLFCSKNNWQ